MDVFDAIGGGVTQGFSGAFGGRAGTELGNAIFGGPRGPGKDAKDALDEMYPGTNPWERLGAGGGGTGGIEAANTQAKIQQKTATQVATIQANAQKYNADKQYDAAIETRNVGEQIENTWDVLTRNWDKRKAGVLNKAKSLWEAVKFKGPQHKGNSDAVRRDNEGLEYQHRRAVEEAKKGTSKKGRKTNPKHVYVSASRLPQKKTKKAYRK